MACSFSSSSFWRAITARIIFLSSSVRWLKSGMSGIGAGTEARGPPWGPTDAAMFLPPPSLTTTLPPVRVLLAVSPQATLGAPVQRLMLAHTIELLSCAFPHLSHPYLLSCSLLALFFRPPTPPQPPPRLPASPLHLRLREAHLLHATRMLELRHSRSTLQNLCCWTAALGLHCAFRALSLSLCENLGL